MPLGHGGHRRGGDLGSGVRLGGGLAAVYTRAAMGAACEGPVRYVVFRGLERGGRETPWLGNKDTRKQDGWTVILGGWISGIKDPSGTRLLEQLSSTL